MAHLFLVGTKGFSSNYPEAGFSYKTWKLYIYVCISSCIISQKPLERVRNHKATSGVIRGVFNPLWRTAQNKKASPDFEGVGGGRQKQESRRYSRFCCCLFCSFFHWVY